MQISDISLLAKKIAVGIVITVVPLFILAGSLWLTQRTAVNHQAQKHPAEVRHAN